MAQTQTFNPIAAGAFAFHLICRCPTGVKQIEAEIAGTMSRAVGANGTGMKLTKNIYGDLLLNIKSKHQETRKFLNEEKFMWCGQKCVPIVRTPQTCAALNALIADAKTLVELACDRFKNDLAEILDERRAANGDAFNIDDYPTVEQFRRKFSVELTITEVADTPGNAAQDLIAQGGAQLEAMVNNSRDREIADYRRDIFTRLLGNGDNPEAPGLYKVAQRLRDFKPANDTTKTKGIFKDSLLSNLEEIVDLIDQFNVADDAEITKVSRSVRRNILAHSAGTLRENADLREQAVKASDAILKKVANFI